MNEREPTKWFTNPLIRHEIQISPLIKTTVGLQILVFFDKRVLGFVSCGHHAQLSRFGPSYVYSISKVDWASVVFLRTFNISPNRALLGFLDSCLSDVGHQFFGHINIY